MAPTTTLTGLRASAGTCACVAIFLLVLAAALPMWVVTSLKGDDVSPIPEPHGKDDPLPPKVSKIDAGLGDGLFKRNVCFGNSKPSEEFLEKVGLTCEGSWQLEGCHDRGKLTRHEKQHCDDFGWMQGLQLGALVLCLLGITVLGSVHVPRLTSLQVLLHVVSCTLLACALASAWIVILLIDESDAVQGNDLGCVKGWWSKVEMCRRHGGAFFVQILALVALGISTASSLAITLLACWEVERGTYSSVEEARSRPLLGV